MAAGGSTLPPTLKSLQHYMKIAGEHDKRNAVVAYYARMYVAQQGIKIDAKSPDARAFLIGLMDSLEKTKKSMAATNEAFKDDIVAQALIEEYVLKLFSYADAEDRAERFNKNVIKAFYTAGMLMDILTQFSELSDEVAHKRKYAKWKAAHIHACLKNGEKPHAGPIGWEEEEEGDGEGAAEGDESAAGGGASGGVGFSAPPGASNTSSYTDNYSNQYPSGAYGGAGGGGYPQQPQNNYSWPDPNYPSSPAGAASSSYRPPTAAEISSVAPAAAEAAISTPSVAGVALSPMDIQQAQKYMKFASSALNFEDIPTAIDNCEKALRLLKTGKE